MHTASAAWRAATVVADSLVVPAFGPKPTAEVAVVPGGGTVAVAGTVAEPEPVPGTASEPEPVPEPAPEPDVGLGLGLGLGLGGVGCASVMRARHARTQTRIETLRTDL